MHVLQAHHDRFHDDLGYALDELHQRNNQGNYNDEYTTFDITMNSGSMRLPRLRIPRQQVSRQVIMLPKRKS